MAYTVEVHLSLFNAERFEGKRLIVNMWETDDIIPAASLDRAAHILPRGIVRVDLGGPTGAHMIFHVDHASLQLVTELLEGRPLMPLEACGFSVPLPKDLVDWTSSGNVVSELLGISQRSPLYVCKTSPSTRARGGVSTLGSHPVWAAASVYVATTQN